MKTSSNVIRNIIIAILSITVCTLIFVVISISNNDSNNTSTGGIELNIDPNADVHKEEEQDEIGEPGVTIPGWGSMTIPAGQTEVKTKLPNPIENDGYYYLTFKIILNDSQEVLYESQLIPPGEEIQDITLSRSLGTGEYDITLHIQPYRISDKTPTNNADLQAKLIVK